MLLDIVEYPETPSLWALLFEDIMTKWLNFSPYRNSPIWATKVGATKCNYLTTLRAEQTDGNRVYCILSAQFDMKATVPGQAFDDVGVSRVLVGGCSLFDK